MSSKTDILIGFVLDKSASMTPLRQATVDGFNTFIDGQRELPGARLSLTLFDTTFDTRYVATPLEKVPAMGHKGTNRYTPGGMTALLDAVGATVKGIELWQEKHPEFTAPVKLAIMTDGEENSSRRWHIRQNRDVEDEFDLINLIEYKQGEGWEFFFLGTGGSEWLERTFGSYVPQGAIVDYFASEVGTAVAYGQMTNSLTATRSAGPGGQSWSSNYANSGNTTTTNTGANVVIQPDDKDEDDADDV